MTPELDIGAPPTVVAASDRVPPTVAWLLPVTDQGVYRIGDQVVALEVSASDNVGIDRVEFERWDANASAFVPIGGAARPPYAVSLNAADLGPGWNQVNAVAFDQAGNSADQYVWIYREASDETAASPTPTAADTATPDPPTPTPPPTDTPTATALPTETPTPTVAPESLATSTPPAPDGGYQVVVPADRLWVDTGIPVPSAPAVNFSYRVVAWGEVRINDSGPGLAPEGDLACTASEGWAAPGLPCWSLVARFGPDGEPFFLGPISRSGDMDPLPQPATLHLSVNDELDAFGDNAGAWTVNVSFVVDDGPTPAPEPTATPEPTPTTEVAEPTPTTAPATDAVEETSDGPAIVPVGGQPAEDVPDEEPPADEPTGDDPDEGTDGQPTDTSSLEVHRGRCPDGYAGADPFADCHDLGVDGASFALEGDSGFADTGTTVVDTSPGPGRLVFAALPAGRYRLQETGASEGDEAFVFCSPDRGATVLVSTSGPATAAVELDVPADTAIVCDWVIVPGAPGPDAPDDEAAEDAQEPSGGIVPVDGGAPVEESDGPSPDGGPVAPTAAPDEPGVAPGSEPAAEPYRILRAAQSLNSRRAGRAAVVHDGDPATAWLTDPDPDAAPEDAYVRVDLGRAVPVGTIRWLVAEDGLRGALSVGVSPDRRTWEVVTELAGGAAPPGEWQEVAVDVSARFVRFAFANPAGEPRLGGIAEVEVWPPGAGPEDGGEAGADAFVEPALVSIDESTEDQSPEVPVEVVPSGPADADGDGLDDEREAALLLDPLNADSDFDGLEDGAEADAHGTDPLAFDTDGDGWGDGDEALNGTDPLDPASYPGVSA